MQRRQALKNIGLSIGGITMSSTIVGLIQSCRSKTTTWTPLFFSEDEAELVAKTLEVILPPTPDVPGANDLNLTQFLDGYIDKISTKIEKEDIKEGVGVYLSSTLDLLQKSNVGNLTSEDIDGRLAFYLKAASTRQREWVKEKRASATDKNSTPSQDAICFSFLKLLRVKGIFAFKISEHIGKNVLAYKAIPGEQKGCVNLEETTQGKAWSL